MECPCGCGRNGSAMPERTWMLVAEHMKQEISELDRFRVEHPEKASEDVGSVIQTGADRYRLVVSSLHGVGPVPDTQSCVPWLRELRQTRRTLAKRFPDSIADAKRLDLTPDQLAHINRDHPEFSYSSLPDGVGV